MSSKQPKPPKLRGKAKARHSLYPLGEFPDDVVTKSTSTNQKHKKWSGCTNHGKTSKSRSFTGINAQREACGHT